MPAIAVQINGVDRTAAVELQSLVVRDVLRARGSTCEFRYRTHSGDLVSFPRPEGGNEIVVLLGSDREFGGHMLVANFAVWRNEFGNLAYDFACQCTDWTWELDKFLVYDKDSGSSLRYASQAAGTTVINIINNYTDGRFTTTGVETGLTAQPQEFDVVKVSEALDVLARETGYSWRVNYSRDVQFFTVATNVAPIAVLNVDTDSRVYDVQGDYGDVSTVKNPILLKDVQVRESAQLTEVFTGNGQSRFFPLAYMPSPRTADLTVIVGNQTWVTRFDDQSGFRAEDAPQATGTAYLCVFNRGVRLSSAPWNGSSISASYNRVTPRLAWYTDGGALTQMAVREAVARGDHEDVINAGQLVAADSDTVEAYARLALLQYAHPRVRLSCKTRAVTGWLAGQYLQLISAGLNLNQRMYVQEVIKRVFDGSTIEYEIHLTDQVHGDAA